MSETERHTGKIEEIEMPAGNDWIQNVHELQNQGNSIEYIDEDDKYFESDDVVYANGKFYRFIEKKEFEDYEDILDAEKDSAGIITFTLKYYNGGCGYNEALETALKNNGL